MALAGIEINAVLRGFTAGNLIEPLALGRPSTVIS